LKRIASAAFFFLSARFKQPSRFSSAENAAFKSRSASEEQQPVSLFLSREHREVGGTRERINGEGANGGVQRPRKIVGGEEGWKKRGKS